MTTPINPEPFAPSNSDINTEARAASAVARFKEDRDLKAEVARLEKEVAQLREQNKEIPQLRDQNKAMAQLRDQNMELRKDLETARRPSPRPGQSSGGYPSSTPRNP